MNKSNSYFILSSSCYLTKGYRRTLIQDFARNTVEYIPNDYYMLTRLLNRHRIADIEQDISDDSKDSFKKFLNFMIDKEYAFVSEEPHLFPEKSAKLNDNLLLVNDAILEIDETVSDLKIMMEYLVALDEIQCPYLQIRVFSDSSVNYISNVLEIACSCNFECVELHVDQRGAITLAQCYHLIDENVAVSRIFLYNEPTTYIDQYNIRPEGHENLLMGEVIHIKNALDPKSCGEITKYSLQFFNEDFYKVSKQYNSCLYKKVSIDRYGNVKNCPFMDKSYDVSLGIKTIVESQEFQKYWHLKKDFIAVCKDCEYRYNCLDCRAFTQGDNDGKPARCKYNPYKLEWSDE